MARGAPKGNQYALGNSGGKNWQDRLKKCVEDKEKEIEQNVLSRMAKKITAKKLIELDEATTTKISDIKDVAMPIVIKGMKEIKELELSGDIKIINYADTLQLPTKKLPTTPVESD